LCELRQEKPLTAKALRTAAKKAKKIKFSFSSFAFFAVEDFFESCEVQKKALRYPQSFNNLILDES
jgi:hypothetical protein